MANGLLEKNLIGNDWDEAISSFTPFVDLEEFYRKIDEIFDEYPNEINPLREDVFNAFKMTPLKNIKVVLLGQDPYPGHGVADGLAFSGSRQPKTPASLVNIFKELNEEYKTDIMPINDLHYLAKQGVFLLNTSLLSRDGMPLYFEKVKEFESFSKAVISKIDEERSGIVFLLFGFKAKKYEELVTKRKNFIVYAPHPSPLSAYRGFFGSGVFKKTNEILEQNGIEPIDWLNKKDK